jgi:isochorismate pyruvate lyase
MIGRPRYKRGMPVIRSAEDCATMDEVRAAIDDLDRQIVALVARRFGYMDAAARIKPDRASVRDEVRKAEVIEKVKAEAQMRRLNVRLVQQLYEQLIETSISYEMDAFDKLRA